MERVGDGGEVRVRLPLGLGFVVALYLDLRF